jgi:hypothetical protein
MARQVVSHRLDSELLERATVYAEARGTTRSVLIEAGLRSLLDDAERGVPELPVADSPQVRRERAREAARAYVAPASDFLPGEYVKLLGERQRRLNAAKDRARAKS